MQKIKNCSSCFWENCVTNQPTNYYQQNRSYRPTLTPAQRVFFSTTYINRYSVTDQADRYIYRTDEGACMVGMDQVNFQNLHLKMFQMHFMYSLRFLCKTFSKLLQSVYITEHCPLWMIFKKFLYSNKKFVWL